MHGSQEDALKTIPARRWMLPAAWGREPERQLGPTVAISLMVRGPLEIFFLVPEGFQIFHLDSTCGHPDGPASGTGRPQGSRVGDVEEVDSPGWVARAQAPGAGLHGQHAPFALYGEGRLPASGAAHRIRLQGELTDTQHGAGSATVARRQRCTESDTAGAGVQIPRPGLGGQRPFATALIQSRDLDFAKIYGRRPLLRRRAA